MQDRVGGELGHRLGQRTPDDVAMPDQLLICRVDPLIDVVRPAKDGHEGWCLLEHRRQTLALHRDRRDQALALQRRGLELRDIHIDGDAAGHVAIDVVNGRGRHEDVTARAIQAADIDRLLVHGLA